MKNLTLLAVALLFIACGSKQQVAQQYPNYGEYYPQQPTLQQGLLDPASMQSNISTSLDAARQKAHLQI